MLFLLGKQITWFLEIVCVCFPHIFVWGSCFWFCIPSASSSAPPPFARYLTHNFATHHLSHTQNFVTHLFVTHHLSHTTLSQTNFVTHTIFHTHTHHTHTTHHLSHATFSHTNFITHTHNFVTHHLSHTTLSYTTLSHTSKHNFVTHQLCHTLSFTHQLCHTPSVSHTIFQIQLCHTPLCHTPTLSQTIFHFACQAWHLLTSTFVLRGRRDTYGRIELAFSDGQWPAVGRSICSHDC